MNAKAISKTIAIAVLSISLMLAKSTMAKETLSADSSFGDVKKGIVTHKGNVEFRADELILRADQLETFTLQTKERRLKATGTPVTLSQETDTLRQQSTASTIEFYPDQRRVEQREARLQLKDAESLVTIEADQLTYLYSRSPKTISAANNTTADSVNHRLSDITIKATGNPMRVRVEKDQTLVVASANELFYDAEKQQLTLEKNVRFTQQESTFTAAKLIYDLGNQTWSIPAVKNERLEIIKP